jgi:hypothetical protein
MIQEKITIIGERPIRDNLTEIKHIVMNTSCVSCRFSKEFYYSSGYFDNCLLDPQNYISKDHYCEKWKLKK